MKKLYLLGMLLMSSILSFAFEGSGTAEDPYQIKTVDDLYLIHSDLTSYYKLMNDIDMSSWIADNCPDEGWAAIGTSSTPFKGTFDGNNHIISNLYINRTTSYNGLFAYTAAATIKNLTIICNLTCGSISASIIAHATGTTVTNCIVKGSINVSGGDTGGIVGGGSGSTITNCSIQSNIKGTSNVGGIAGACSTSRIENCTIESNITGENNTGGLIGSGTQLTIDSCLVKGDVYGTSNVGGLVGCLTQVVISHKTTSYFYYNHIHKCLVIGNIEGTDSKVGGLIGYDNSSYTKYVYYSNGYSYLNQESHNTSDIQDCYYGGNLVSSTGQYVGGIVGYGTGTYRHCYAIGTVKGSNYVGGLVGNLIGSMTYDNSSNTTYKTTATLRSCVCLCSSVISDAGYARRIAQSGDYSDLGTSGTVSENKALLTCQVYIANTLQSIYDSQNNGYALGQSSLQKKAIYSLLDWDFESTWSIEEGKGFPYLTYFGPLEISKGKTSSATFDFTSPSTLTPSVTPSEDEDAGVNITSTTFTNGDMTLSFGLGTRTQTYSARLWTNEGMTYNLRAYQNGTMTISAKDGCNISKITFEGDDVTSMTCNVGTVTDGIWTGEAQSVTFTIGASCNKINTIDIVYSSDAIYLTDAEPTIVAGTYEAGNVTYTRTTTAGKYATFCLPYDVAMDDVSDVFSAVYTVAPWCVRNPSTGLLQLMLNKKRSGTVIAAGTPFIACAKKTGSSVISNYESVTFEETTANPEPTSLVVYDNNGGSVLMENTDLVVKAGGTYTKMTGLDKEKYRVFDTSASFGKSQSVNTFRAYIYKDDSASSAKISQITLNFLDDDNVTGINSITGSSATSQPNGYYNLNGQRINLNAGQKGIFIINGKKFINK